MTKPLFPPTVDSTLLSTFRSCPRKFYLQYIQHWKPMGESVHLIAGGAFASGIEAARVAFYIEGKSPEDSEAIGIRAMMEHYGDFEPPPGSSKTPERMAGAMEFYFDHYPLGRDGAEPIKIGGSSGIELSFARPLDFLHPTSSDPVLYTGRSDMVAHFAGQIYIFDEKTTSQLGASWARQWDLRSQFTGYQWGCQDFGIKAAGTIIRGVSILKTKYDTLQAITYRGDWEIERWLEQVHRDLSRMYQCWKQDYWDYCLDHACNEYGGCPFTQICKSNDPDSWLPMYFERRVWDPLQRKELSVEEFYQTWGAEVPF